MGTGTVGWKITRITSSRIDFALTPLDDPSFLALRDIPQLLRVHRFANATIEGRIEIPD